MTVARGPDRSAMNKIQPGTRRGDDLRSPFIMKASDHYFSSVPQASSKPLAIEAEVLGHRFRIWTDRGVFARRRVDRGTRLLLEAGPIAEDERILDLGCGYGIVGLAAARQAAAGFAVLADVNLRAVGLAARNLAENGIGNAMVVVADGCGSLGPGAFSLILCNPPIRAGWEVVFRLLIEARECLRPGGRLRVVARTRQGAPRLQKRMAELFGAAEIIARESGYKVIESIK